MNIKKTTKWMSALILLLILAACGNGAENTASKEANGEMDMSNDIHVITREDGSGTRGAFVKYLM